MNDKNLMENILLLEKGGCDLFLHGTIESGTENVHQAFQTALNASLNMQDSIYDEMTDMGWYPTQQVEQKKINTVKQKFSAQSQSAQ
ncbi:MAG: spore coat protein [Ruminiclostridium sp.]|nr:spore coat protein [Ruminiclostridium sp.]